VENLGGERILVKVGEGLGVVFGFDFERIEKSRGGVGERTDGLDGRDGVNPINLFDSYKKLILGNKVTPEELENAMKTDTLKNITGIDVKSGYGKTQVPNSVMLHG
jgi:hypothetical protein